MKCPSCGVPVADDVAICPKCDAVVDPSMFDNTPPESDEGEGRPAPRSSAPRPKKPLPRRPASGAGPAVARRTNTGVRPAVKQAVKQRPGGQAMPEAPGRKLREAPEPRPDWRVKDEPRAAPARTGSSGYQMVDPEDFWGEIKSFVGGLNLADKLAFTGAFSTLISCFFPWKDTITDGDVLGLMSLGAAVFAVSLVIILAIIIRVRKVMPALHALVPWLVQFGGSCFCIVWCLIYIKLSLDTTIARSPIGNYERFVSSPSAGVIIAGLMSVLMLAGTLMGLKEKPR